MIGRLLATLLLVLFAGAGLAQDASKPVDYTAWEAVAVRAEDAVQSQRASDEAFKSLRAEVVNWRAQFQAAQTTNQTRIETLKTQITALGPVPADGTAEAPEIAKRRAELNDQLAQLEAPRRKAEEAFSRANGIVNEIDALIRTRQADKLMNLGPSPLNPALWAGAFFELVDSLDSMLSGVVGATTNEVRLTVARENLPVSLFLVSLALVLMFRARFWIERLAAYIGARNTKASAGLVSFIVSLGQVLLPVAGVYAMVEAVAVSGLYGPRGELLLGILPAVGFSIFISRWLGGRIFPRFRGIETPLNLSSERRAEGRFYATVLGIIFGVDQISRGLAEFDKYPVDARAVINFPLFVVAGLILFRLGQMLRQHAPAEDSTSAEGLYRTKLISVLGRAAIVIGVLGPVLAAIGYSAAAEAIIYPSILTLGLVGALTLLQGAIRDSYAVLTGREDDGSEALVPVLLGFLVTIAMLPLLALVWGASVTDLTELWTRFKGGVTVGETTISPGNFLTLTIVFVIGYLITRLVQGALKSTVLPKTRIDTGGQTAIVSGIGYVGVFLAAILAVTAAGINLSSLAIVAGALSVGIGFGLQNIVSNFVSGIILLIERPISQGDMIEVGGQMGYVRDISVRSTRIETFDRTDVIVPNADLVSGVVTNWTRGNLVGRVILPVGVAYGTDTRLVEKILREIAEAHPMVVLNPPPGILFVAFGADSLNFEIRAIIRDVNWKLVVTSELNHEIAKRFGAEGIEIPFAQRDIWLRNPEALRPQGAPVQDQDQQIGPSKESGSDEDGPDEAAQTPGTKDTG